MASTSPLAIPLPPIYCVTCNVRVTKSRVDTTGYDWLRIENFCDDIERLILMEQLRKGGGLKTKVQYSICIKWDAIFFFFHIIFCCKTMHWLPQNSLRSEWTILIVAFSKFSARDPFTGGNQNRIFNHFHSFYNSFIYKSIIFEKVNMY